MKTLMYKTSLNEDFEKALLNLEKVEEDSLADLKKLASLDDIVSIGEEYPVIDDSSAYFHKCADGTFVDVRGVSFKFKKMDDNHLINLIKYMKKNSNNESKLKFLIYEARKRKLMD